MAKPDLVVTGSLAFDDIKTPFGEVKGALGGSVSYASVAASIFTRVGICAIVGRDMPNEHLDFFRGRGISLDGLEIAAGKSFRWTGAYDYEMGQAKTLGTQLGVFTNFRPTLAQNYKRAKYHLVGNIIPKTQLHIIDQLDSNAVFAVDTHETWINTVPEQVRDVMGRARIVFLNDVEARLFCKTPNLIRAARAIQKMGPKIVLIKKGEHGALLFNGKEIFAAPAFPLENVVDPTGAGDSFAGGFMGWLAKTEDLSGVNLRRAVMYGTAIAAFNAEHFGLNKLKTLTKKEVEARYRELREIGHFP